MLWSLQLLMQHLFWPPPVSWKDIIGLVGEIERVDDLIEGVRIEQGRTSDAYRFALMEYEIEALLKTRSALCRRKRWMISRARRQGPQVDLENYERLV